jgi:DNA mismatch endonuclease, patch repair protein
VGRRDTPQELALRSALHRRGLRFRVDKAPLKELRRRADVVFGPTRVAVFVDGCFWHGCPIHGSWPKANRDWWQKKILAVRHRDMDTDHRLAGAGWLVIRVWEHEDAEVAADLIEKVVRSRKSR